MKYIFEKRVKDTEDNLHLRLNQVFHLIFLTENVNIDIKNIQKTLCVKNALKLMAKS